VSGAAEIAAADLVVSNHVNPLQIAFVCFVVLNSGQLRVFNLSFEYGKMEQLILFVVEVRIWLVVGASIWQTGYHCYPGGS
jgi:hypothetical protein